MLPPVPPRYPARRRLTIVELGVEMRQFLEQSATVPPRKVKGKAAPGSVGCVPDVFFGYPEGEIPEVVFGEECWHCNCCVLDYRSAAISLRIPLPAMMLYVEAIKWGRKSGECQVFPALERKFY